MLEDCVRCGACCFSESPEHARVTGDDHARLGDDAERLVEFRGNKAFMRIVRDAEGGPGHCAALVLDPRAGTFICSVYDARPDVCRELERGSPACEGERHGKAGRPARALLVLGPVGVGAVGVRVTPTA